MGKNDSFTFKQSVLRSNIQLSTGMNCFYLISILWLAACTGSSSSDKSRQGKKGADTAIVTSNDTIPETRKTVSRKPVDSYYVTVGDPKLDRKFGVSIYETSFTFQYLLHMQYEAMLVTDTLTIPNIGIWPVVQVRPGEDRLSCIIGFLDSKKTFKEYKMLTAQGDKLKLVVLKKYSVGKYRTVY